MTKDILPPPGSCDTPVDRNLKLAEKLGIAGTPTLIFADGQDALRDHVRAADQRHAWRQLITRKDVWGRLVGSSNLAGRDVNPVTDLPRIAFLMMSVARPPMAFAAASTG